MKTNTNHPGHAGTNHASTNGGATTDSGTNAAAANHATTGDTAADHPSTHQPPAAREGPEVPKPPPLSLLYVGMDVHADSITIATAEAGREGEVRLYGKISSDVQSVEKVLRKLGHPARPLHVCYEAGPCGFHLTRRLKQLGIPCAVVAPSLTPKGSGDKTKTDRRDALMLARLHRAGELTAVHVPDVRDEVVRDLCRARTDAVHDRRSSRHQLKALLLRHGFHYKEKTSWNDAHMRYLRELPLPDPATRIALEEYLLATDAATERIERLEAHMQDQLSIWHMEPMVRALMGLKGFQVVAAMIVVSEIGDIRRFAHPRKLMAYLGLVPSESSSGESRSQGSITKAGNGHLRWILNECAQHYRLPPKVSPQLSVRQQAVDKEHRHAVQQIAWRCQNRLYDRGRKLAARGKMRQKVQVALARELCAFVWELMWTVAAGATPTRARAAAGIVPAPGRASASASASASTNSDAAAQPRRQRQRDYVLDLTSGRRQCQVKPPPKAPGVRQTSPRPAARARGGKNTRRAAASAGTGS